MCMCPIICTTTHFYPRSPCGERHLGAGKSCDVCGISIHALLAESDTEVDRRKAGRMIFLSTLSLRRATVNGDVLSSCFGISIHALLAESDHSKKSDHLLPTNISIHALLAESDGTIGQLQCILGGFLSTLSLRRATCGMSAAGSQGSIFLSTLSLRRATELEARTVGAAGFLSTLSLRRATAATTDLAARGGISIHALLAESDSKSAQNSGALLRIWNKFYGDCIFMLTGKAVFYPFCPCFFHIFWCEGSGNFMIAFPSH